MKVQNIMKSNQEQEHDVKSFDQDNAHLPNLELETESKEEQEHIIIVKRKNCFQLFTSN